MHLKSMCDGRHVKTFFTRCAAFSTDHPNRGETNVRKVLAILLMTGSVIAVAPSAHAGEGGAVAAGLLGGLAAGTMIGIAASNPYPPPPPPVYVAPEPVACYWMRGYWDGWGWVYPRVRVCE
jgi:hypothetical protein